MMAAVEPVVETAEGEGGTSPLRRCIATSALKSKWELVRFVVSPEGIVVPDITERLPGRGLWLTARRDIVASASAKGLLAKAARMAAVAPADLADQIEALLARRCCELLGVARRAGQATAGFEKVRSWLAGGRAGLLLEASEGSEDGRRKLRALAGEVPMVDVLRGDELGPALGRDHAVHVAVKAGKLAQMLRREAARLSGFRNPAVSKPSPIRNLSVATRRQKSKA